MSGPQGSALFLVSLFVTAIAEGPVLADAGGKTRATLEQVRVEVCVCACECELVCESV